MQMSASSDGNSGINVNISLNVHVFVPVCCNITPQAVPGLHVVNATIITVTHQPQESGIKVMGSHSA